jgi:GAF domain-containing protein
MAPDDLLASSLSALSSFFVGDASMHDTLERVSELARDSVAAVDFVGLTMLVDGRPATAVFTDPGSPEIDQAQYRTGRGPCVESFRTGEIRMTPATRAETRWPEFADACLQHGILSTLSVPLANGDARFGAMNLYASREDAFDDVAIASSRTFAAQASVVLANAAAYWDARTLSEHLQESIESRAIIEQAKGIIMGSMRCTADEAFGHLVRQSQHTNRKVREVAQGIVNDIARHRNS